MKIVKAEYLFINSLRWCKSIPIYITKIHESLRNTAKSLFENNESLYLIILITFYRRCIKEIGMKLLNCDYFNISIKMQNDLNKSHNESLSLEGIKSLLVLYNLIQFRNPNPPAPSSQSTDRTHFIPLSFARELAEIPPAQHKCYECCRSCYGSCLGCIGTVCTCCDCNPYIVVPQGFAGIQTRFGKAYRVVDPGLYFVNSMCETMSFVDIKVRIIDVPKQMVMTKDNVVLQIDSVLYWHVLDPFVAQFDVENIDLALKQRTMSTLRDTVGAHSLQNVIENRKAITSTIKEIIDPIASSWGVVVESILINDLRFSTDLQENLSAAAKQQRIGESKVIAAKSEVQAAKLLRESSDILNTPAAIQMRHLDTMINMCKNSRSKIIFTSDEMKVMKK